MAREPEDLIEMRRALGAQLAAFREAAQLSQGQLAIPTAVDRTTVTHIEKGRSRGDERFWKIADDKCRADGALLAGFHAWQAAWQDHEVRTRQAQLSEARAQADALRAKAVSQLLRDPDHLSAPAGHEARSPSTTPDGVASTESFAGPPTHLAPAGSLAGDRPAAEADDVIGELAALLCEWIRTMKRRGLLHLLGWATSAVTASPVVAGLDTDEQERLARAIISPSRVDERVINHLKAILQHCKQQEDALGSRAVLPTVLGQRNLVHDLLRECPTSLRPSLLSVYSDMSTSIGYCFFDGLNDPTSAAHYWDQARAAAQDAGNTELSIYALGEISHAAYWQGKVHTAIDTVAAARNLLSKTDDPLMQVYVANTAAQAYAIDGQYEASMTECEKAQDGLASVGHVPAESPAYWYHEGYLASEKSGCLLRLGKPQEAVASANNGLALFDDSFVNNQAFCMLFLGNARLQSHEIDEAARVIGDAAGLATQTRSTRLVKQLRMTRARMQPWQDTAAIKGLDDRLVAYGLASSSAT